MYTIATAEFEDGNIVTTDVVCTPCIGKSITIARDILLSRRLVAYVDIWGGTVEYRMDKYKAKGLKNYERHITKRA